MPSPSSYAITNATLVDVDQGRLIPDQVVVLLGERIERIGPQGSLPLPAGAQPIDGRGRYLMPGLVDAHVHYLDPTIFGRLMLAHGVTLVRDMGLPNEMILPVRDALNRAEMLGPQMATPGAILDGDPPCIPLISQGVTTPEAGRLAVRRQVELGADFIKLYSRLDREVFLAMVDEAHRLGRKAAGHVPETVYIEEAAKAGMDSFEHMFGFEKAIASLLGDTVNLQFTGMLSRADYFERLDQVDPAALQAFYGRLCASGVTVCPTAITFQIGTAIQSYATGDFPYKEYISPMVMGVWSSQWSGQSDLPAYIWKNWMLMVCGLHQAGVPLMVGTDLMLPGVIPGYAVHQEMALWQEAGIPPADVLRSATLVPARFLGLDDRLGSLGEGKTASLVLLDANPLEDVHNARQIEGVFLRGQYFSREDLSRLLAEARGIVSQAGAC